MSDSPWNQPGTVEGFVRSPPNAALLQVAAREFRASARLLDIGCGAGRNALPLATAGWEVIGTDSSPLMLTAAAVRVADVQLARPVRLLLAPMHQLPLASDSFDFVEFMRTTDFRRVAMVLAATSAFRTSPTAFIATLKTEAGS